MTKPPSEDLNAFLRRQDAASVVAVLLELATGRQHLRALLVAGAESAPAEKVDDGYFDRLRAGVPIAPATPRR